MSINDFLSVITITLALVTLFAFMDRRVLERELKELNESLQHENRKIKNQVEQLERRIVDLESNKEQFTNAKN